MLTLPMALVLGILWVFLGDGRVAHQAAHEICPDAHVARVDGEFRFGCDGRDYAVRCEGKIRKECTAEPL